MLSDSTYQNSWLEFNFEADFSSEAAAPLYFAENSCGY